MVVLGISGGARHAAAAACVDGKLHAFCELERVSRVRRAGIEPGKLPDLAIDAVLGLAQTQRQDLGIVATAGDDVAELSGVPTRRLQHAYAHAATAFLTSPFRDATVLVCDRRGEPPQSVWAAGDEQIVSVDWNREGASLARLYADCSQMFGFRAGDEHNLEALARSAGGARLDRLSEYLGYSDGIVRVREDWQRFLHECLTDVRGESTAHRARLASGFQARLGELLLLLVADIQRRTSSKNICLAGGLFFNTYFNTLVHESGIFERVFIPPNPGNAGLAAGCALAASADGRGLPLRTGSSPFLGPGYGVEDMKATLDNCKLSYDWLDEQELIDTTVDALSRGLMVGWFQGRMEWGHRALGNRSILASPLSPYALDNLNVFLKQRERHKPYGLSLRDQDLGTYFAGPTCSRYMEYEYRPIAPDVLRSVVPPGVTRLRVQTVGDDQRLFSSLHAAFAASTGVGVLVNTSFNGFNEPIVCSPRDAIRVFFGTGLDLLVLGPFVVRK